MENNDNLVVAADRAPGSLCHAITNLTRASRRSGKVSKESRLAGRRAHRTIA
jgi:hypothetical protein